MSSHDSSASDSVQMEKTAAIALTVAHWRLAKWLEERTEPSEVQQPALLRHVARQIGDVLSGLSLEAVDLTGKQYDPGMAAHVIDTLAGAVEGETTAHIAETVSPIVYWNKEVIKHAEIVTRRTLADASMEEPRK